TASSIGSVQLPPISTLFPYTTLFRSSFHPFYRLIICLNFNFCFVGDIPFVAFREPVRFPFPDQVDRLVDDDALQPRPKCSVPARSEEHTSELQSRENLVCRLLLEKKK